jgi:uncharacterized protein (TIRG00374 family)
LLGAGNIALRGHAPQWVAHPDAEIVAVADLSESNLEAARALFPAASLYACAEDLLEREALDFCDVCTPPSTHRLLIEEAARRSLHVVCEKPLAPTLSDAEAIAEVVRHSGIVFQPCHQYHHSPQWQTVRSILPRLGRIYLAEYEVHRTEANEGNRNWAPLWRTDRAVAGGGILVDHGAHIFYQLRSVLGEPRAIQATVRTLQHHAYRVEDTALVVLDYGTCLAQVSLTWAARRRAIQYRFVGELGELVGDDRSLRIHADTQEEVRFEEGLSRDSSHSDWYAPLFQTFTESVRARDCDTDALDEALYVARVIDHAYASSEQERSLPLVVSDQTTPVPMEAAAWAPDEAESEPPVQRRWRRNAIRVGTVVALLGAGAWAFHDIAWSPLWAALTAARPGLIAVAALVNLCAVWFQAARWQALVRPLSRTATLGHAFKATVVGFAVSMIVPARAGELARMQWLSQRTGLARASVLASIVLDHLVNAAGLILGLILLPFFLTNVPLWLRPGAWFFAALFTLGVLFVLSLRSLRTRPAEAGRNLAARGLANLIHNARAGVLATVQPRALGLSLGASFLSWALEVNVTMLAMRAVGLTLPIGAALLVLLAVNLALALPLAPPGNLGTLEVGATLALVGFGVAKEQALAFGLVYHFLQILPIGILGLVIALASRGDERLAA